MEARLNKIIKELTKDLPQRYQLVLAKRYGLDQEANFTLKAIGEELGGVTRERVRQIKESALDKVRKKADLLKPIFSWVKKSLSLWRGVRREDEFLKESLLVFLNGKEDPLFFNQFKFILDLSEEIKFKPESPICFGYFYLKDKENLFFEVIEFFKKKLLETGKPISLKSYFDLLKKAKAKFLVSEGVICSFLSISKEFGFNNLDEFGLTVWSEISPKKISEKIYLVFKKLNRPLHFQEAAGYLMEEYGSSSFKPATIHNELIKDPRFILIGRGIYALKEWGYQGGTVKEVLERILKKERKPLSLEEIKNKLGKELIVKESTILLNLSSSPFFEKTKDGKWRYRKPKEILEA